MQAEYVRYDNNIYKMFVDACHKFRLTYEERFENALATLIS